MINFKDIKVNKDGSRIYGDFAEKVAFALDVNPVNLLASAAGGYAASRTHDNIKDKKQREALAKQTLENDHYANIQNLMKSMKIVFTPINVIYSVNGQVFEIIKADEMSSEMRQAFISKDADYYRNLLLKKINMELQLAEQVFAHQLLKSQIPDLTKTAHFSMKWFEKCSMEKTASSIEKLSSRLNNKVDQNSVKIDLNFDIFRPFNEHAGVFSFDKVANYFAREIYEILSHKDLSSNVKIGFLPDRVLFTLNGQLMEQLTVMNMNQQGYEAFRNKDEEFFKNFFLSEIKRIEASIIEQAANDVIQTTEKQASEEETVINEGNNEDDSWVEDFIATLTEAEIISDEESKLEDELYLKNEEDAFKEVEKTAATLEELRSKWKEELSIERDNFNIWEDHDIHPLVYDWLLDERYGKEWHDIEFQTLLQQINEDFDVTKVNGIVLDKLAMLQTVQSTEHTIFMYALTFEKFLRAMNSKTIDFSEYEYDLEFEEIMFGFDMAVALSPAGEEVFIEFSDEVAMYVAKLMMADGVRFVSDQLYDETNETELDFFNSVNGFLSRMWKDQDSKGMILNQSLKAREKTNAINSNVHHIISSYAEFIDIENPYDSVREILKNNMIFAALSEPEKNVIVQQVGRHIICTLYLSIKELEYEKTISIIEGDVENE